MKEKRIKGEAYYKILFLIAGFYDFVLGASFLFFYRPLFNLMNMSIPSNPSYLTFSALVIMFFGIFLFMISLDLRGTKRMIIFAIFIKFSYIITVVYYFLINSSYVDFPFRLFAFFDFIFMFLFLESLRFIRD